MDDQKPQCSNCRFAYVDPGLQGNVLCRRYPPAPTAVAVVGGITLSTNYPALRPDAWCGEYRLKLRDVNDD